MNLIIQPLKVQSIVKFVYSEKATKFCEIFTLFLSTVHTDKSIHELGTPQENSSLS